MAESAHPVPLEQAPAQAPMGAEGPLVGHLDLAPEHRLDGLGREHLAPVRRSAAVDEEPGEPRDVARRGTDPAVRTRRAGQHVPQRSGDRVLARLAHVSHRRTEPEHLLGQRHRVREAERDTEHLLERLVPGPPRHHLDDPAENVVRGAGVRHRRAGRVGQAHVPDALHIARQAVVAATGVTHEVALDTAGVVEQLPGRDGLRGLRVGDGEVRQDACDRRVQVQLSGVGEQHHEGGGVALADRADLEHRVRGHRHPGPGVQHTAREFVDRAVGDHGQGGARHMMRRQELVEPRLPAGGVECRDVNSRTAQRTSGLGRFLLQVLRHGRLHGFGRGALEHCALLRTLYGLPSGVRKHVRRATWS